MRTALAQLKKVIYSNTGYIKIVSDYNPSTYQYGYLAQGIDAKPFNNAKTVQFSLYFSCLPQIYSNLSTYNKKITSTTQYTYLTDSSTIIKAIRNRSQFNVYSKYSIYAMIDLAGAYGSGVNVSASISKLYGNTDYMAIIEWDGYDDTNIVAETMLNDLSASFTTTMLGDIWLVVPINDLSKITYGGVDYCAGIGYTGTVDGVTSTYTMSMAESVLITDNTAMGCKISKLSFDFTFGSTTGEGAWLFIVNKEAQLTFDMESFRQDLTHSYISSNLTSPKANIDITLTYDIANKQVYLETSNGNYPMEKWCTFIGEYNGTGNEILVYASDSSFSGLMYSKYLNLYSGGNNFTAEANWWSL